MLSCVNTPGNKLPCVFPKALRRARRLSHLSFKNFKGCFWEWLSGCLAFKWSSFSKEQMDVRSDLTLCNEIRQMDAPYSQRAELHLNWIYVKGTKHDEGGETTGGEGAIQMLISTSMGVFFQTRLWETSVRAFTETHLYRACANHGAQKIQWWFNTKAARVDKKKKKSFAEPIKCEQGEQQRFESAYCKRKTYITHADERKDANGCN